MIRRRLTMMALGAGASYVSKLTARRSIDQATQRIEDRLPTSLVKVAGVLPGDVLRVGGTAVVAGNATMAAGRIARSASGAAVGGTRSLRARKAAADALLGDLRSDWRVEVDRERRVLRAALYRRTRGADAGFDEFLDVRSVDGLHSPLPMEPAPVAAGRRRPSPTLPSVMINRVQRSYRPPIKAWDQPQRRRGR